MTVISRRQFAAMTLGAAAMSAGSGVLVSGCGSSNRIIALPTPTPTPANLNSLISATEQQAMQDVALNFISRNGIPGLSVAIALNDGLVYSRGFGVANLSTGAMVAPSTPFRIASISKPFTATAVFRLVEQNRLSIEQFVFGPGGILGNTYAPYEANVELIKVKHLLSHTAGFPANNDEDPAFNDLTLTQSQLIQLCVQSLPLQPLNSVPGRYYSYSNIGYIVLGRVIEAVTGLPYETAVTQLVLDPCGITDMRIAGSTLAERLSTEAVYYDPGSPNSPYLVEESRLDAAGGWLSTASDLVNFIQRVDNVPQVPDILSATDIATMTSPFQPATMNSDPYGLGWQLDPPSNLNEILWFHTGSQPGQGSFLGRSSNGFNVAAIANTRSDSWGDTDLGVMLMEMVAQVSSWPQ